MNKFLASAFGGDWKQTMPIGIAIVAFFGFWAWFFEYDHQLAYCWRQILLWVFAAMGANTFFSTETNKDQKTSAFWLGVVAGVFAWYHYFGGGE